MWYFAWILGLPLAAAFAVLNAMWYELLESNPKERLLEKAPAKATRAPF
jgi:cyd operon protein YbgT